MKLTAAVVLALVAASVLANFIPYEDTAVYARALYERDGGEGSLNLFDKRGGAVASSLFKSFAGAAGSMSGRVASNSAQYGLSRDISPSPSPSPSSSSTHSTTKHLPTRHRRPHLQQLRLLRPSNYSSEERTMQQGLSETVAHLESLEKCRREKAKTPSLFKATSGAIGTMDSRVAGCAVQLGPLETMIPPFQPPPLPMARRALFPVAPTRSSFAPIRAIKNAFSSASQATARVYRKSESARKKGKDALIAFLDGASVGITKKKD